MNEENNFKNVAKGVLKSFAKRIVVIAIIVVVAIMLCGASYYKIKKEDFKNVSNKNNTYQVAVNNQGKVTYTQTNSDGTKTEVNTTDMAENLRPELQQHISDDDQEYQETMDHIIGAETVTTMPYIEPSNPEGENEGQDQNYTDIQGQIKFYRYTGETEANDVYTTDSNGNEVIKDQYRLKYVTPQIFESKKTDYLNGINQEIFNCFTMDDENNVIVAYGSEEKRVVTTDDKDLTQEIVRDASGEDAYTGNSKDGFQFKVYSIYEKKIDYLSIIENYIMPSNLLYALLIQTSNADFVKAIADLAYGNEIAIGIYDNQRVETEEETYTYQKIMEIKGTANYNFSNINSTYPRVDSSYLDISNVPKDCNFYTSDGTTYYHTLKYNNAEENPTETTKQENMYITEVNDAGEITKLGTQNQKTFMTKFSKTVNSTSEPTVGMILADTWIAKWKSTYAKDDNVPEGPIDNDGTKEEKKLIEYDSTDKLLKLFNTNMQNDINNKLDTHKHEIIADTIERIVDKAVEEQTITVNDLTVNKKKSILEEHLTSCSECWDTIKEWWGTLSNDEKGSDIPTTDRIYEEISKSDGALIDTLVDTNFMELLETYVNDANEELIQSAETAKTQLETQVITTLTLTGDKKYTNISFNGTTTKQKTSYSKTETTERTKDGEKFSEVFNNEEFHAAKQTFLEIESWFWEYIDENEDTAKLKNILKYLLNIATDSEKFGTFTPEDIEEIFDIFEPDDLEQQIETTSDTGMKLFQQYVRMFENGYIFDYVYGKSDNYTERVSKYITQDRTAYYVKSDGYDHPTVGFGVDLFEGGFHDEGFGYEISPAKYLIEYYGYTEAQLKDMSGATTIPVEIVDELEQKQLQKHLDDKIKMNDQENLGLTKYQIYALASLGFNTGRMYQWGNFGNFEQLCKQYWNEESDNKYGENSWDYDHKLYTEFFYKYRFTKDENGNKVESDGLIERRESEWRLFQTGYMDNLGKWVTEQEYPESIRTFKVGQYIFPEYPQKDKVGDVNLYANERFGYPDANRTLGSSGCGIFTISMILSGLLGDATIDPITFRDKIEASSIGCTYHAWNKDTKESNGSYGYKLYDKDFLKEAYGVKVEKTNPGYSEGIEALNQGKCIFAHEPRHFVAVVPVPDEFQGQGYEFFVLDSARGHTGAYKSIQDFKQKTGKDELSFYAIIAP